VFVILNAMFMFVCLKTVIFLIFGLQYVKIARFFVFVFILLLVEFLLHLYF